MCYFLYGAVNGGINVEQYNKVIQDSKYHFNIGNKQDVNTSVEKCNAMYRITSDCCDCNTPLGQKSENNNALKDFDKLLNKLKSVRGIKHIYLSKNWVYETNEKEETVHIDDIDSLHYLANIEENCLYKIELHKWHY